MRNGEDCFHTDTAQRSAHTTCVVPRPVAHVAEVGGLTASEEDEGVRVSIGGITPTNKSRAMLGTLYSRLDGTQQPALSEAEAKTVYGIKQKDISGGSYRAKQLLLFGLESHMVCQGPFHLLGTVAKRYLLLLHNLASANKTLPSFLRLFTQVTKVEAGSAFKPDSLKGGTKCSVVSAARASHPAYLHPQTDPPAAPHARLQGKRARSPSATCGCCVRASRACMSGRRRCGQR